MIDKKVVLVIVALVIVAIVVLAASLVTGSGSHVSGDSFSALFDKMEIKSGTTADLYLPIGIYANGAVVTVTDKVIARQLEIHNNVVVSTTLYFGYEGSKWVNDSSGTTFNVLTNLEKIQVVHAEFSIHLNGDWSGTIHSGTDVTLQTTTQLINGLIVLKNNWVPVL